MKCKIVSIAVLAVMIYSCASKSSIPTTEIKKVEPTASTAPAPAVMTADLAEGKSLYENNCAKCHDLYNAKDFSPEEWKPIIARMQKQAHLDDLAGQKIYNYLAMN